MHRLAWLLMLGIAGLPLGCGTETAREPATAAAGREPSAPKAASEPRLVTPPDTARPPADPPKLLSDEQLRDGWIALFDGRTLFGWVANSDAGWSVRDGAIVSPGGEPGLLLTTSRFQDYELRCEAWLEPGGNSGLFLRTVPHPTNPAKDCLEFNLCDGHETFPTGSLVARAKAAEPVKVEGDWHA
ncbi:MAG TPA: DUF1080 domain-containing protein, partial [Planctomycetaceae bacterium]